MGVDHDLYVISAAKYMELIRPKLIKFYGPVDFRAIMLEQARRKGQSNYLSNPTFASLFGILGNQMPSATQNKEMPVKKFLMSEQSKSFQGDQDNIDKYHQICDILKQESVYHVDERNDFLRMDKFLGTIDFFGDGTFKVCNILNIENFFKYMSILKAAFKSGSSKLLKKLEKTKKIMKKEKKEKNMYSDQQEEEQNSSTEKKEKLQEKSEQKQEQENQQESFEEENKKQAIKEYIVTLRQYSGLYSARKMFKEAFKIMNSSQEEMYVVFMSG